MRSICFGSQFRSDVRSVGMTGVVASRVSGRAKGKHQNQKESDIKMVLDVARPTVLGRSKADYDVIEANVFQLANAALLNASLPGRSSRRSRCYKIALQCIGFDV